MWDICNQLFAISVSWNDASQAPYTVESNPLFPEFLIIVDEYFQLLTTSSGILFINSNEFCTGVDITVTGTDGCTGTTSIDNCCFLAGSLIALADGLKPIEEVRVGDLVVGAFGEINRVIALQPTVLGSGRMMRINGEHSSTSHHPHVSVNRQFYTANPSTVEKTTYGSMFPVIDASGNTVVRMMHGLKQGRVGELNTGVELKTLEGSRTVKTIELYDLPPETKLYHLVVDGSHTYHAEGYAVTGWPDENDFDYDNWTKR